MAAISWWVILPFSNRQAKYGETLWLISGLLLLPCRAAGALPPEKGGTAGSKRSEERCPAAFAAASAA